MTQTGQTSRDRATPRISIVGGQHQRACAQLGDAVTIAAVSNHTRDGQGVSAAHLHETVGRQLDRPTPAAGRVLESAPGQTQRFTDHINAHQIQSSAVRHGGASCSRTQARGVANGQGATADQGGTFVGVGTRQSQATRSNFGQTTSLRNHTTEGGVGIAAPRRQGGIA